MGLSAPMGLGAALLSSIAIGSLVFLEVPNKAALLPMVVAPLVAAVVLPLRRTVLIAGVSLGLMLMLPQAFVTHEGLQYVRLAAVAGLDVLAVVSTVWRERLAETRVALIRERERTELSRRQALELNDHIYQSLFTSKMWADLHQEERSAVAFDRAMVGAAELLEELLDDVPVHPGAFRRSVGRPASEKASA